MRHAENERSLAQWISLQLAAVENALLAILLSAILLIATGQILLRNLFSAGLPWADSLIRVLVLWLALVGAVIATRDNAHIGIDVLVRYIPGAARHWLQRFVNLFGAAVCAVIAWYSALLVWLEREDGLLAFAQVPVWLCQLVMPMAFAAMALHFVLQVFSPSPDPHAPS